MNQGVQNLSSFAPIEQTTISHLFQSFRGSALGRFLKIGRSRRDVHEARGVLFACTRFTAMKHTHTLAGRSAGGLSSTKAPPADSMHRGAYTGETSTFSHERGSRRVHRSSSRSLAASAGTFQVSRYAIGAQQTPGPLATCRAHWYAADARGRKARENLISRDLLTRRTGGLLRGLSPSNLPAHHGRFLFSIPETRERGSTMCEPASSLVNVSRCLHADIVARQTQFSKV